MTMKIADKTNSTKIKVSKSCGATLKEKQMIKCLRIVHVRKRASTSLVDMRPWKTSLGTESAGNRGADVQKSKHMPG